MQPTANNVSEIIIAEMMTWNPKENNPDTRRIELTNLSERLIRYFAVYSMQPEQLDGLPGGYGMDGTLDAAVGRRNMTKRGLMASSTGLVVRPAKEGE